MPHDATTLIITSVVGAFSTVGGVIVFLFREIIKYLFARIAVLEGREANVLAEVVKTIEKQVEELTAQGALVRELAKDSERREWLRERQGGRE